MLSQHRRHPWCMSLGCQRLRFLLSGLKWAGQTQILAQHGLQAPFCSFQGLCMLFTFLNGTNEIPCPIPVFFC